MKQVSHYETTLAATERRYAPRAEELDRMTAREVTESFLVRRLFKPGEVRVVATDLDRLAIGAAMPIGELELPRCREFGTRYFTEGREVGIVNIGDSGAVRVDGQRFTLDTLDCLYIGCEEPVVTFESGPGGQSAFYFLSSPAHRKYPVCRIGREETVVTPLGDPCGASKRRIRTFIHPDAIPSCQLVMGLTELDPGSVWNTMPAHTHSRRSEVYLYFDLEEGFVAHFLGQPDNTRHVFVRDREAVLSPPWSTHFGAGDRPYRFVWGMAGENKDFADVDPVSNSDLR